MRKKLNYETTRFSEKNDLAAASLPGLAFLDSLPLLAQSAVMPKEVKVSR
jgi:hypothetical protein